MLSAWNLRSGAGMSANKSTEALLDHFITALYEAATAPDTWPTALNCAQTLFGGSASQFYCWNVNDQCMVEYLTSTSFMFKEECDYYRAFDPRWKIKKTLAVGVVASCQDYFDSDYVRRSDFYQDHSIKADRRYTMTTKLFSTGPTFFSFAVSRSPCQEPFDSRARHLLEGLQPHLKRAAAVHAQLRDLRQEIETSRDMLDNIDTALFVLDAEATVVRLNRAAEMLLRSKGSLGFMRGKLVALRHRSTAQLHALVQSVVLGTENGGHGGAMVLTDELGNRFSVSALKLVRHSTFLEKPYRPLVLITVSALTGSAPTQDRLAALFGLTRAEALLAREVADGIRLREVSLSRGVGMPTLRTQLKAVFAKTETTRQAELARLIARLPTSQSATKQ
jgi:DNA-binding CsgD family transcriptional regulator/PAS domain-containing protein